MLNFAMPIKRRCSERPSSYEAHHHHRHGVFARLGHGLRLGRDRIDERGLMDSGPHDGDDVWHVERLAPSDAEASPAERDAQYRRDATWDRYRQEAADARQRAATVTDPPLRQRLLEIAEQYESLAASIDQLPSSR